MAITIQNTNYNGEVLEEILTLAATGNELVEKGLIRVEPGVHKKKSIPRMKTTNMLRQRKEQPEDSDSKGEFIYSEKVLEPTDFMAYTTFNPRTFESIWRRWQPKGNLVFSELTPEVQNELLKALSKQVKFELGYHYINGVKGTTDDKLFNGIVYRMENDADTVKADSSAMTMVGKLNVVRRFIPKAIRNHPGLRYIMSVSDFDRYDDELTSQQFKGANYTDTNPERFKGINIEKLANWPDNKIVATITGMDTDTNLWAAVNLVDDAEVVLIDKVTNSGERYFFKLLMKADTNIAFGEEVVMLNSVAPAIVADPTALAFPLAGGDLTVEIEATEEYEVLDIPEGFSVLITDEGLLVSAYDNTGGAAAKNETLTVSLKEHKSKKVIIALTQPNA